MFKKALILIIALGAGLGLRWYVDQQPKAPVNLLSADQIFTLEDATDSRLRVAYFGFTHCPDICPTSLAVLAASLRQMDDNDQAKLLPLFISLDPERDTPEKSAEYAQFFHPNIVGVSTSDTELEALAKTYGVLFKRTELEDSELEYSVDHSSFFYLINNQGELLDKVPHTMNPAILTAAIDAQINPES
ncbi:SCO family protein [Thaumasiovibrio subtropicus]|uniref:SCO family protein n=1 Tax=Thaumasiovibrio subtropicus TaxID=1891207 RepID=UPI000B351362|nr:SCO family protein [Thaumasiovibrio subtropicus]